MNKEKLIIVKQKILAEPDGFYMANVVSECNSKHCILGWVLILEGIKPTNNYDFVINKSAEILDIDTDAAYDLFYGIGGPQVLADESDPTDGDTDLSLWTPKHAAEFIDQFIVEYRNSKYSGPKEILEWGERGGN